MKLRCINAKGMPTLEENKVYIGCHFNNFIMIVNKKDELVGFYDIDRFKEVE